MCTKIRWLGMFMAALWVIFFTTPMVTFGAIALWRFSMTHLALALFIIPIGLLPLHLFVVNYISVCITESEIIVKRYGGWWKKHYLFDDLAGIKTGSYRPYRGNPKLYFTVNMRFSDGRIFVVDESNCANFKDIRLALMAANPSADKEQAIYGTLAMRLWLIYVLIAVVGGMGLALIF